MTLPDFLLYLAAGRLITWLAQIAGILRPVWDSDPLLKELSQCDLCLGFWVYLALGLLWAVGLAAVNQPVVIFGLWPALVELVLLAALSSLMAHLLRLGWLSKFGCEVV